MLPGSEYQIRDAKNEDSSEIKRLVFSILKEYGLCPDLDTTDSDLLDIYKSYPGGGGYFVVIEKEKEIMGCAGIYRINESECELRKMYLNPSIRGKGIGRLLLEKMISKAISLGFNRMKLETASILKEAISLYIKYGFKQIASEHIASRCDQVFELNLGEYVMTSNAGIQISG